MSYQRNHLGSHGMIVNIQETFETQWVQLMGTALIRCDHQEKETGSGAWLVDTPSSWASGRFIRGWQGTWLGGYIGRHRYHPDSELWLADEYFHEHEYEKDVS